MRQTNQQLLPLLPPLSDSPPLPSADLAPPQLLEPTPPAPVHIDMNFLDVSYGYLSIYPFGLLRFYFTAAADVDHACATPWLLDWSAGFIHFLDDFI